MSERLYIVIDQSQNMRKIHVSIYDDIEYVINSCDDDVDITLITFNHLIKTEYSGFRRNLCNVNIRIANDTARLYDAIIHTIDDSMSHDGVCNIIICTMGVDTGSVSSIMDAKEYVTRFQNNAMNSFTFLGTTQYSVFK